MDKIVKGIGWLTIAYVGLYLIDTVAVQTGMDTKLEKMANAMFKKSEPKTKETNKVELGFH